jgi:RNA polymerase sigma-70 factor (ECF subfamily)
MSHFGGLAKDFSGASVEVFSSGIHLRAGAEREGMSDLAEASDAQLVTLVARFDEVALAEIYRRHGGAVFGLARRVLNNQTEAEDVTQEVFLRLWRQPERFDSARGTLRSFLMTQAHARAVDVIRSLTSSRRREVNDAALTANATYDVHREAWDVVVSAEVQRALRELPPQERRAIELAYFQGHTYVEVARILDEPEGTVKSRIRNGMRRMRGELSRQGIGGAD